MLFIPSAMHFLETVVRVCKCEYAYLAVAFATQGVCATAQRGTGGEDVVHNQHVIGI